MGWGGRGEGEGKWSGGEAVGGGRVSGEEVGRERRGGGCGVGEGQWEGERG